MKFEATESIGAPQDAVWQALTEAGGFEALMGNLGAGIERTGSGIVVGTTWRVDFEYLGMTQDLNLQVSEIVAPETLSVAADSTGVNGTACVSLEAEAPDRTRMALTLELSPRSMAGRLVVQSLRVVRDKIEGKIGQKMRGLAREIEITA